MKNEFLEFYILPYLRKFRPRNLCAPDGNMWGYLSRISCSGSQVASDISWLAQRTFTKGTVFLRSCFSLQSRICTGHTSYDKSSWSCMWLASITWEGSWIYFRSCGTWNTLCTIRSSGGISNQYTTSPTLCVTGYGSMYRGLSFPTIPNCAILLVGDTLRNTWSPTWNAKGLYLRSV